MQRRARPRVTVVVTPGCHLCETAVAVVAEVCGSEEQSWEAVELATVAEPRRAEWRELVPVVLVDGEVHDVFRVDRERLRTALSVAPG
jgi:coenzyme F420-reducing hydrogenase gamma subunit